MGKAVKKIPIVGGALSTLISGPEQVKATQISAEPFNISKEANAASANYADLLHSSQAAQQAGSANKANVINQMGQAALGQGPSLAEVQMKAAQDRNLAQQLAAVQAQRGGNAALNQRNLVQSMASSGRQLGQDAAATRLQERDAFLQQANLQDQALRTDIQGQFGYDVANKRENQARVTGDAKFRNDANTVNTAATNQHNGMMLGGLSTLGLGIAGGGGMKGIVDQFNRAAPVAKASGGQVRGPGTDTSDSIPAKLSNKEFVVKAEHAKKPAILKVLTKINSGKAPSKPEMAAVAKALAGKAKVVKK